MPVCAGPGLTSRRWPDDLRGTVGGRWIRENPDLGKVVLAANSMLAHAEALVSGFGVGPIPCVFGDKHPRLRRLYPHVIGHHEIWLAVHPDMTGSASVRSVIDCITAIVHGEAYGHGHAYDPEDRDTPIYPF